MSSNPFRIRTAVLVATALLMTGCATSHHKASSSHYTTEAQGAPAIPQTTEVLTASGGVETANQADIQLHKEEMVVGKRTVSNGGVLIRTVVQTENVSQPVEVNREEYVIERVPASQAAGLAKENIFQGREIYIPLTREEAFGTKRALVSEKIQLAKKIETDHQTVSTPVRSEDVEITKVSGKAPGTYSQEPMAGPTAAGDANSLKLLREEMVVGKTVVDNGGVKLQKIVRTQTASQPVELQREEYTVDRSSVSDPQVVGADFSPKEIRMSLSREEPVVGTRIEPTELVRVRKQVHTDTQTVSGTVRKENVEIVKLGAEPAAVGGTSAAGQSGATVLSESGSAKELILKGKAVYDPSASEQVAGCRGVIQVSSGGKIVNYYVIDNQVSRNFESSYHQPSKVTAKGFVEELDGKLMFTPSKMMPMH